MEVRHGRKAPTGIPSRSPIGSSKGSSPAHGYVYLTMRKGHRLNLVGERSRSNRYAGQEAGPPLALAGWVGGLIPMLLPLGLSCTNVSGGPPQLLSSGSTLYASSSRHLVLR